LSFGVASAAADNHKKQIDPRVSKALKASEAGNKTKALEMLQEVYHSDGSADVMFLIGKVREDLQLYGEAYAAYEEYLSRAEAGQHAGEARRRLEALADKVQVKVVIESEPPGADVHDGTALLGSTPLVAEVSPQQHVFRVSRAGYKTVEKTVKLAPGKPMTLQVALVLDDAEPDWASEASADGSQLSVRTNAKGALVMVDGVLVGTTNTRRSPVTESIASGVHAVTVHKSGLRPWGAHVRAEKGQTVQLDLGLGRDQSRGAKLASWSIGGIGAASVFAGVGIGVGALLDDDESLAESADVLILGGVTAVAAGVVIHWVTRSRPTTVKMKSSFD